MTVANMTAKLEAMKCSSSSVPETVHARLPTSVLCVKVHVDCEICKRRVQQTKRMDVTRAVAPPTHAARGVTSVVVLRGTLLLGLVAALVAAAAAAATAAAAAVTVAALLAVLAHEDVAATEVGVGQRADRLLRLGSCICWKMKRDFCC
jgi:hypothetical protein